MSARRGGVLAVLMLGVLAVGCEGLGRKPTAAPEIEPQILMWPEPPLQPRIRLVRVLAQPEDLGSKPSFWRRVGELLVGRDDQHFVRPTGVAATEGAVYVADPGAQALWIVDLQGGRFRRIDRAGKQRLVSPVAVALGAEGRLLVADSSLARIFVYAGDGTLAGNIASPELRRPAGIAYDATRDRLYVSDSGAHRVWRFAGDGRLDGAIGRRGTGPGEFNFPTHVALDRDGHLYVTDSLGYRVQHFSPDGSYAGQFGRHGDTSGDFASPKGIGVDSEGHVYVVDALFDAVQIFDRRGQLLLAFGQRGVRRGQFWLPGGLFIDRHDRIYVADAYNRRIQVFQYLGDPGDG